MIAVPAEAGNVERLTACCRHGVLAVRPGGNASGLQVHRNTDWLAVLRKNTPVAKCTNSRAKLLRPAAGAPGLHS